MGQFLEMMMIISFGISWPISIYKSYRARSTRGKSIFFLCFIWFGYSCGIASKLTLDSITYVLIFYVLNLLMVSVDIILYFRNARLERGGEPR